MYFFMENERDIFHRKSKSRFLHGMPLDSFRCVKFYAKLTEGQVSRSGGDKML